MFGGQDDNAGGQQNNNDLQIPDAAFSGNDDNQQTPPAEPTEDKAGEYIMTDPPAAPPAGDDNANGDGQDKPAEDQPPAPAEAPANGMLQDLKRQVLQQLTPLVSHLDQSPEEKFRTTMMMIQASDNADLLKDAFDAAQAITDEKAKAQALLDVVNEINYFTQVAPQQ